uniref:Pathogen-related protein n=1 Tax=Entomoneis paludosa TaxID=265537 RepID=A0A7S2VF61_9STRA|mmetsp:Transcript_1935/g.4093  ORF Transcript_1935/g.4093 Transcript_1935/m.4093 type:complete len:359 (+) Transcript_1935:236-1312(+)
MSKPQVDEELANSIRERRFEKPVKFMPLSSPSLAQTHCQGPLKVNGSGQSLNEQELEQIKQELEELKAKHAWKEPKRDFMDDPMTVWMFDGVPDYSLTNYFFLKERTHHHAAGSLEETVEELVKTWEMERSHKPDCSQHCTTNPEKFRFSANGGKVFDNVQAHQVGNYNVMLDTCPKEYYDAENTTWQDSHHAFHKAFPAFPWEVLQVFSGPPKVAFTWRHWAHFTGEYNGKQGDGQLVEMYGFCTAELDDDMKMGELQVYFDPVKFFQDLLGTRRPGVKSVDIAVEQEEPGKIPKTLSNVDLTEDLTEDSASVFSAATNGSDDQPWPAPRRRKSTKTASSTKSSGGGCPFKHSFANM